MKNIDGEPKDIDAEPLGDWHDTENKSGCYCVVCLICVKEEYFTDGVCGRCDFDDPCKY